MKSFSFKSDKATLRVLKEPKLPKKRMSFDRALYLIILGVLVVLLVKYVYTKTAVIKANGQVLMNKVEVNFTHDIRLLDFYVSEGDTITEHQHLFKYIEDQFDNNSTGYFSNQENTKSKARKILELEFKIKAQRIKIKGTTLEQSQIQKEKQHISKMVLLDVYTIDKLRDITAKEDALKTLLAIEKSELALYFEQLKTIKESDELYSVFSNNSAALKSAYKAPIDGIIGQISVVENETCYRTESVLTIHDPEKIYIKAYFDLDEIKNILVGDEVTIEFPDKTKSKGIINKFYVSTYALPEEFQKTYEPTERSIVVEIMPSDNVEAKAWATYHKLNITIKKNRFL